MYPNSGIKHIKSPCESCELRSQFIFRHLNVDELRCLSSRMDQVHYAPGDVIFKEGASPQGFMCLKEGKVKITRLAPNGNEQIVDLKSSPDTIGIRAFSTNSRYRSSAVALDNVVICTIPSNDFNQILDSCPAVFKELLHYMGERLVRADEKLISLTQKHVKSRLADTLLLLKQNNGEDSDGYVDIPLKRSELAQLSNMNISNVIRTLSMFKRKGLIKFKGRKAKIISMEALTKISKFNILTFFVLNDMISDLL